MTDSSDRYVDLDDDAARRVAAIVKAGMAKANLTQKALKDQARVSEVVVRDMQSGRAKRYWPQKLRAVLLALGESGEAIDRILAPSAPPPPPANELDALWRELRELRALVERMVARDTAEDAARPPAASS